MTWQGDRQEHVIFLVIGRMYWEKKYNSYKSLSKLEYGT